MGVKVKGRLEPMIKGLSEEVVQQLPITMIGKPIIDENGVELGKITKIDLKSGLWYGEIERTK